MKCVSASTVRWFGQWYWRAATGVWVTLSADNSSHITLLLAVQSLIIRCDLQCCQYALQLMSELLHCCPLLCDVFYVLSVTYLQHYVFSRPRILCFGYQLFAFGVMFYEQNLNFRKRKIFASFDTFCVNLGWVCIWNICDLCVNFYFHN